MPRILVPLDETELAEEALPWAAAFARAMASDLHLISVYAFDEDVWKRANIDPGDSPARIAEQVTAYLDEVAARPALAGLNVSVEARLGNVAEQVADAALAGDTRMIVLVSHGKGGLKRWMQGSVADELVRTVAMPVLVVRPGLASYQVGRVLVTVDGSETSERALPVVREIANAVGAELHLMRVVNPVSEVAWTGIGPAPDMGQITEQYTEAARAYLERIARPGEMWDVMYGRPLDAILDYAREKRCEVIAMGSHGRGGIARLALGSTADAVMRAADRPVLIVPDRDEPEV